MIRQGLERHRRLQPHRGHTQHLTPGILQPYLSLLPGSDPQPRKIGAVVPGPHHLQGAGQRCHLDLPGRRAEVGRHRDAEFHLLRLGRLGDCEGGGQFQLRFLNALARPAAQAQKLFGHIAKPGRIDPPVVVGLGGQATQRIQERLREQCGAVLGAKRLLTQNRRVQDLRHPGRQLRVVHIADQRQAKGLERVKRRIARVAATIEDHQLACDIDLRQRGGELAGFRHPGGLVERVEVEILEQYGAAAARRQPVAGDIKDHRVGGIGADPCDPVTHRGLCSGKTSARHRAARDLRQGAVCLFR